jgi:predicted metal-dependent hydrolase
MSLSGWLMQQLSLFGEAAPVSIEAPKHPRPEAQKRPQTPDFEEKRQVAGVQPHFDARKKEATGGRVTVAQGSPFHHPRANRQALLDGQAVAYHFRRGKRRTIGFSVNVDGLTVSAPRWVLVAEVDGALKEKSTWIVRKLHEMSQREARMAQQRIEWRDGTTLPFLGENIVVVIDPRASGAQLQMNDQPQVDAVTHHILRIGVAHNATPEQLRDAVQAWLMRQAKRVFAERIAHFAPQLGVQAKQLKLSSAGTRWGSAHSDGSIRLNWRLVHFKLATIDYVVVHELSHLREMNHSPRFWQTVESVMPDYVQRKGELKDEAIPLWE